jgi:hypothetical protein
LFSRKIVPASLAIFLETGASQDFGGSAGSKKGNDSEMAPQAIEIAQNRLGNGACGVGRRWQRNVAE